MQMIRRGSKLWKLLGCTVKVSLKYDWMTVFCVESYFTRRAYRREVLIQVWLLSDKK